MNKFNYVIFLVVTISLATNLKAEVRKIQNNILDSTTTELSSMKRLNINKDLNIDFEKILTDSTYIWEVTLCNVKTKKKILLHRETLSDDSTLKHQREIGEDFTDMYTISGAMLDDKNLYIVYDRFGTVSLNKYHFVDSLDFIEEKRIISSRFVTPALGKYISKANLYKIHNSIYIQLEAMQTYSEKPTELFVFDDQSLNVDKILFSSPKLVTAIYVDEDARDLISQEKEHELKYTKEINESRKKKFSILKKYLDQEYYYYEFNQDEEKREDEGIKLDNQGFSFYEFFDQDSYRLTSENKRYSEEQVRKVLSFCKLDDKITLLEAIQSEYCIYFICENIYKQISIIRYSYDSDPVPCWYIGDYSKKKIIQAVIND